jgi:nucleoside diphosphate kinase
MASVCLVPDIYHKEIEKKCFKFIWNGKPDKVKRNLIINSYERGGLQMIDIKIPNLVFDFLHCCYQNIFLVI